MKIKAKIKSLKHQIEFSQFGILTNHRFGLILGGFGAGKSKAIPRRIINLIKYRKGKAKIMVIAPTYDLAEEINYEDLEQFLEFYKAKYKINRGRRTFHIKSGDLRGKVVFKSANHPEKIVGVGYTDFIIDEFDIIRYKNQVIVWRKAIARIRECTGATGGICTTPEGYKMTYDLFEKDKIGITIKAKTRDNPFLPEDYIQSLEKLYDSVVIEQYLNAEYVNILGTRAFYAFKRDQLIDPIIPDSKQIYIGMDFNVSPMTCCIGIKISGKLIIFDYIYLKNGNTWMMCDKIKEKFPDKDIAVYPDMTGIKRQTSATIGINDIVILRKYGFRVIGTENSFVRDGLLATNKAIEDKQVLITKNCEPLIIDLDQNILDEHGEIDKSDPTKTHMGEGFRYLVTREFPIYSKKRIIQA